MMAAEVRLQKFLSRSGVASRRRAEEMIVQGRVSINGSVVREMGVRVDPDRDVVQVDGAPVETGALVWIALHKPAGLVSTRRDPQHRPTVYKLLPREHRSLFHVGRLDAESEGLMLFTNDGDRAHRLLHPSFEVDRVYEVEVAGRLSDDDLERLRAGVRLEDGLARARHVERLPSGRDAGRVRLTLREGRKREVRRMLDAVKHPVTRLRRVRYGPVRLGGLEPGGWRMLTAAEIAAIGAGPRSGDR
jgi:pseudouridine synthase